MHNPLTGRRLTVAAIVVATAVVLSACGGGSDSSEGSSKGAASDRVITIGQTIGVSQLDPNISTLSSERVMWNLLYDGLTKQTESGEVEPDLATEWSASDDGLTWTFTLRDGVKFHDGRALVADDVVQVVQRVLDEKNASPQRSKLAAVTAVAATDEKTVTFTMSGPMPQMPAALVDVKIIDAKNLDKLNTTGNGTGPYKLDSFVPDQELSVVPNPDYWAGQPGNGGIKIVKYADETAGRTALGSGAVDILWAVPYDQVSGLQDSGLNIVSPSNPSQTSIFEVDGAHGTFADAQARQALSYAVDRKTMQEAAFGGLGEINYGSTLVSPSNKYYDKAAVQDYSYDLDKAKELFAEAGVKQGTKFTCWASSSSPQYRTQCEILQQSLAEIGYTVAIQVNEGSTWAAKFYPAGKDYSDLIVPNFLSREPAPLPFVASYFGKDGWSESNWAGTPEYEMTKSSIKTATEESDIKSAFADFQKITSTEQPVISVLNVGEPSATGTDIEGVWIESDGTIHVEGATGK